MKVRKILPFSVLILVIAGVQLYRTHRSRDVNPFSPRLIESSEIEQVPLSAQCVRPMHGDFKFHSRVLTPFKIAQEHDAVSHPERLANEQVKFLRGFFHFSEIDGLRVNTLASSDIQVVSARKVPYRHRLRLDPPEVPSRKLTTVSVPEISVGEPGFAVEYNARVSGIVCERTTTPKFPLELTLPLDPYLAYWYVPKAGRRLVSWNRIQNVTNPCSYEQMADLKQPNMYWYVWNPKKKGKDFDCSALLDRDKLVPISALFEPERAPAADYSIASQLGNGPIHIALIFGFLLPRQSESALRELELNASHFGRSPNWPNGDPGIQIANMMLDLLGNLTDLGEWKVSRTGGSYIFSTKGHLKESKREVEIDAFLGPTVEYQKGTKHWEFLADALEKDDFIFYQGHAGMGTTFGMEELSRQMGHSFEPKTLPHYQFVGILSCFSTDYYGDDIKKLRSKQGLTTDLMLAGYEGFAFMMIPAVLQYVDLSLAGRQVSIKKSMERFLGIDEPIHLSRYTS